MTNGVSTAIAPSWRLAVSRVAALLFNRYTFFLLGVYAYSLVVNLAGGLGGVTVFHEDGRIGFKKEYLELTLLFYLYCYANLILRPSRWQAWLAAVPLLLAYLGQDIYFLMYSNVFRMSELAMVPELLGVLSPLMLALLVVCVVLPLGYFVWSINWRRPVTVVAGILPLVLLIGAAEYFPKQYLAVYSRIGREIPFWSDAVSAENNGRFMMLLYREAERQTAKATTATFRDRGRYDEQARSLGAWVQEHGNGRNVHLVVLESFVDPTLFAKAKYSRDPHHPDFRRLAAGRLGLSVSPVAAGQTSQAEFELLCGVPAFQELAGMEFNNFTGAPAHCLPGTLGLAGYRTMAANAYKPAFFNTPNAYRGIGFEDMFFPREYTGDDSSYLSTGDTSTEMGYMFDATLYAQNLAYVTPLIKNPQGPPLFNYLLTVYGHFPHVIDEHKRPRVVRMLSSFKDPQLERAANQFFHRSAAVATYVDGLLAIDPESLIILVSDHVPPGQYGRKSYRKLAYLNNRADNVHYNRILVIDRGKAKKYATVHHYDVPAMILNTLTDGAYCRERSCAFTANRFVDDRRDRHEDYMRLMAHASE